MLLAFFLEPLEIGGAQHLFKVTADELNGGLWDGRRSDRWAACGGLGIVMVFGLGERSVMGVELLLT